jgi:hypothetical protein
MRRFRCQFTIGQLLALVGVSALFCYLLSAGLWPVIVAIAVVAPGFFLDRAKGGAGVLGAMIAGILGFVGFGIAASIIEGSSPRPEIGFGTVLTFLGLIGLAFGATFGFCAWLAFFLAGLLNRPKRAKVESSTPTVRYGPSDRGLPHPRSGRRQP